ncbi:hypothetical protein [Halorubrum tebenquichense]|uniref:hypothetical protein n=1 Tax=Halorubrum tebenquichense TaxID=119434 RepID=UPI001268879D|nr:hypothetical protein [Halorubrum tebenquichense]
MRRRALLSLLGTVGIGSLAGCLADFSTMTTPEVVSRSINPRNRSCSDTPNESATIAGKSEDGTRIEVEGNIAVPRVADRLYIQTQTGVGESDRDHADMTARIDFGPSDSHENTDVPECEGQIAYDAEVKFTHPPKELTIRHTVRDEETIG